MMDLNFTVDAQKCSRCGACVADCPHSIIKLDAHVPTLINDNCLQCQHCLAVCPTGAIAILGFKPENSIPINEKALPSNEQMKTFVRARRSVRRFAQEDVAPAIIDELLADTANAPTGCNNRELTFTVIDGRTAMQELRQQVMSSLEQKRKENAAMPQFLTAGIKNYEKYGADDFFRNAPHLLIVSANEKATCGHEDVIIALSYFELLAQSAGLGTTWCGMLQFILDAVPELADTMGLGKDTAYCYAMMFGKPAVKYARTVQHDTTAKICKIKALNLKK
jgi:ferredoxin